MLFRSDDDMSDTDISAVVSSAGFSPPQAVNDETNAENSKIETILFFIMRDPFIFMFIIGENQRKEFSLNSLGVIPTIFLNIVLK